ncbi:MAG TPA: DICT sensory domain-containing protein [Thermoleophilaceae bacterium]|nr:DICT sensory domain-containing protein [Thermoleophilaceae bacterium]
MDVTALTIGQLAERTGVAVGTLRMWESRHAFPRAERLPSGHRRYPAEEVERVRQVLEGRQGGLSLAAAIERVTSNGRPADPSIVAGLRRRRPDLHPYPMPKRLLIGVSRALEDEYLASAERAVLVGSFQLERFYLNSHQRWREMARTADLAVALADFDEPRVRSGGGPWEVPVAHDHPLAREWAVVVDAPGFCACLAGWERPDEDGPDMDRVFEVLWSVEREVVREATRIGLELAVQRAPEIGALVPERLSQAEPPASAELRAATALTNRMLSYVTERATG